MPKSPGDPNESPTTKAGFSQSIPHIATISLGVIYFIGLLIYNISWKSGGVESLSIAKAQFLSTGTTYFILLIAICIAPPLLADYFHKQYYNRKRINGEKYGFLLRIIYTLNGAFFYYLIFFYTFFITTFEWHWKIHFLALDIENKNLFIAYSLVSIFCIHLFRSIYIKKYYTILKIKNPSWEAWIKKHSLRITICVLLLFSLATGTAFYFLVYKITWIYPFIKKPILKYFPIAVITIYFSYRIQNRLATNKKSFKNPSFLLITISFITLIVITNITNYSYTLYRCMPSSRGGRMPQAIAVIYLLPKGKTSDSAQQGKAPDCKLQEKTPDCKQLPLLPTRRPYLCGFILDSTDSDIYFVPSFNPFSLEKAPPIQAISKTYISKILFLKFDVRNHYAVRQSARHDQRRRAS